MFPSTHPVDTFARLAGMFKALQFTSVAIWLNPSLRFSEQLFAVSKFTSYGVRVPLCANERSPSQGVRVAGSTLLSSRADISGQQLSPHWSQLVS